MTGAGEDAVRVALHVLRVHIGELEPAAEERRPVDAALAERSERIWPVARVPLPVVLHQHEGLPRVVAPHDGDVELATHVCVLRPRHHLLLAHRLGGAPGRRGCRLPGCLESGLDSRFAVHPLAPDIHRACVPLVALLRLPAQRRIVQVPLVEHLDHREPPLAPAGVTVAALDCAYRRPRIADEPECDEPLEVAPELEPPEELLHAPARLLQHRALAGGHRE
eukprot:CAMPEP_0179888038 /NCGR_PEP_ID=MMETSP0982-20121206/31730_1 /TAXON_ID=483367 /ORGANISM="non described non described, Strain CCMP 2436" /LENGTH=221 /DNA_ID=CAMNT_0021783917 /DNA_START=820 /DNA_END=1482 /DNA_ORIENTATION=+